MTKAPEPQVQQPVPPTTPYEQQPVSQQYFAQPQAAPVQYVVQAQSLKGKSGWLAFFMVIAGLASLGYISMFFTDGIANKDVTAMIFSPLLFAFSLAAVILIALEMKIAKWVYIAFWATTVVYTTVTSIVAGNEATEVASTTVVGLVVLVLVSLYFITSKRVKETLIK